jgi:drug/metabolite transporter superfamily protein YnfA
MALRSVLVAFVLAHDGVRQGHRVRVGALICLVGVAVIMYAR